MPINISELFSDILPDPRKELQNKALTRAALASQGMQGPLAALSATTGYNSALSGEGMRAGLNRMTGGAMSTAAERLQKASEGIDTSTPQGQAQLLSIVRRERGAGAAEQLREVFRQRNLQDQEMQMKGVEQQQRNEQLRQGAVGLGIDQQNADTALLNAQTAYFNAVGRGSNPVSAISDAIEKIDPDRYDPGSFGRFQLRLTELAAEGVQNPMGVALSEGILLQPAEEGWEYRAVPGETDANGNQKYVSYPVSGSARQEVVQDVRQRNSNGEKTKREAGRMVELVDGIFDRLDSGDTKQGTLGKILRYVPGNDTYELAVDLDRAKGIIAFNGLMEAKNSSSTGASGFGQLTEKELNLLENLLASLEIGLSEDELREQLNIVRDEFDRIQQTAYTDWTLEEVIGLSDPKMKPYTPSQRSPSSDRVIRYDANGNRIQ